MIDQEVPVIDWLHDAQTVHLFEYFPTVGILNVNSWQIVLISGKLVRRQRHPRHASVPFGALLDINDLQAPPLGEDVRQIVNSSDVKEGYHLLTIHNCLDHVSDSLNSVECPHPELL